MIFVLIPIAWLTIIAIIVNACRSAARGDEMLARATSGQRVSAQGDRVAFSRLAWGDGPALEGTHRLRRVETGALTHTRGVRARGEHCATGS